MLVASGIKTEICLITAGNILPLGGCFFSEANISLSASTFLYSVNPVKATEQLGMGMDIAKSEIWGNKVGHLKIRHLRN